MTLVTVVSGPRMPRRYQQWVLGVDGGTCALPRRWWGRLWEHERAALMVSGLCLHMKGAPAAAPAPKLRLKLQDVVNQARAHLLNNRVRISVKAPSRPAESHSGDGAEEPAVFTDDLLGAILGNADLCEHLNMRPVDISGRMQLYEGLAINFVYDLGAQSNKVCLVRRQADAFVDW